MHLRIIIFLFSSILAPSASAGTLDFGRVFLVDQYKVKKPLEWLRKAIVNPQSPSPLGVILWNFDKAGKKDLFQFTQEIQMQACQAGKPKLWITTDFEGGADRSLLSGATPPPIQHFRKSMTKFPHPRLLGEAWDKRKSLEFNVLELAELFGAKLGQELFESGISSPLSVGADLATNQMWYRGLHPDPQASSKLLKKIFSGFLQSSDGVFFTKHFPGLGPVKTNTHGSLAKAQYGAGETLYDHLLPFKELIDLDRSLNKEASRLGIMVGHALYPEDPNHIASRSTYLLQDVLRKKLHFEGLVVSDAMWMGIYQKMHRASIPQSELPMQMYLQTFLAGVDVLMIKAGTRGAYFKAAVDYFKKVYQGDLSAESWKSLETHLSMKKKEIRQALEQRLAQTSARLKRAGFSKHLSKIKKECGMVHVHSSRSRPPSPVLSRGGEETSLEKQVSLLREQVSKAGSFAGKKQADSKKKQL